MQKTVKCSCGCEITYDPDVDVSHVYIESPADIGNIDIGKRYVICPKCYSDVCVDDERRFK